MGTVVNVNTSEAITTIQQEELIDNLHPFELTWWSLLRRDAIFSVSLMSSDNNLSDTLGSEEVKASAREDSLQDLIQQCCTMLHVMLQDFAGDLLVFTVPADTKCGTVNARTWTALDNAWRREQVAACYLALRDTTVAQE